MKAIEVLKNIANSSIDFGYEKDATESIKEIESIKKENTRLKKQLSKNHYIECSCSFCNPVGEKQSCENCNHYNGTQTCNKFVTRGSYNYKDFYYKDFYCNKWESK